MQNIDQESIVTPTGALFERATSPESSIDDLRGALALAFAKRLPIVFDLPADFAWIDVGYTPVAPIASEVAREMPDDDQLDLAVGLIASSSRPLVLAGRGAIRPPVRDALVALADTLGAPMTTTLQASGLFRGRPGDLGVLGTLSTESTTEIASRADCVVAFGASLNRQTTSNGGLFKHARVVQCDVDPEAIGALTEVTVGLVGDAQATAEEMTSRLRAAGHVASAFQSASVQQASSTSSRKFNSGSDMRQRGTVDLDAVLAELERSMPADRTVVLDGSRVWLSAVKAFTVPEPRAYVHTVNFGSIGLGMGNAIGAYHGAPHRPVMMICGDGGFMLGGLTELNTAVRHEVDLVAVILNDGAYGAEHIQFRRRGLDPAISMFRWPDFADVARSIGADALTVRSTGDFVALRNAIERRSRPLVIDVRIDPDTVPFDVH